MLRNSFFNKLHMNLTILNNTLNTYDQLKSFKGRTFLNCLLNVMCQFDIKIIKKLKKITFIL